MIIGSDAPTLPRAHLHQALDELMTNDVVIGPSDDGGYYLVGARLPVPELFSDVRWSTPEVLSTTLARLGGRSYALLPPWHDVDSEEDLGAPERGARRPFAVGGAGDPARARVGVVSERQQ